MSNLGATNGRLSRLTRLRRGMCAAGASVVATTCVLALGAPVASGDSSQVDPAAAVTAADALPAVESPATPAQVGSTTVDPTIVPASDGSLQASGTLAATTLGTDAADGVTLQTPGGSLQLTPQNVDPGASAATPAGDAIAYANTAQATDTLIKPTSLGAAIFTQIRDATAPETFSWRLSLSATQQLRMLPDGGAAVFETATDITASPTVIAQATAALDAVRAAGAQSQLAALTGVAAAPADTVQQAASDVADAASVASAAVSGDSAPTPDQAAAAGQRDAGAVGSQLADAKAEFAVAKQQAAPGETVVAALAPPWAKDATGTAVSVSYAVSGNEITMTVRHHAGAYAYPIEADPWYFVGWGWWYQDGGDCVAWYDFTGTINGGGLGGICASWFAGYEDPAVSWNSATASAYGPLGSLNPDEFHYCSTTDGTFPWPWTVASRALECAREYLDAREALANTAEYYSPATQVRGQGAAFRHCEWVGLMVFDVGYQHALAEGRRHELGAREFTADHNMGLNNNSWGTLWGSTFGDHNHDRFAAGCRYAASVADQFAYPPRHDAHLEYITNNPIGVPPGGKSGGGGSYSDIPVL